MKTKKVLCHINNMSRGGAERVMSVLIDSMVKDGIEVVLVTLNKSENEYQLPDIRRVVIDESNSYKNKIDKLIKRYASLRSVISQERPDLVLSFTVKENLRATVSMLGMKIPLLVSVRNDPAVSYKGYKILSKLMEKKAAGCVFQTGQAREYFSDAFAKRSRVIMNPLDDKYLVNYVKHLKCMADKNNDEVVICNVARIGEQKNQMMLVQAFKQVCDIHNNCTLKIFGGDFGDGVKQKLEQYIKENGLSDKVLLMGVSDVIEQELAKADIFVLSSNYEGMPNALMEAMATGLAVVSTDCPCGGPATLIDNKENGILIGMNDVDSLATELKKLIENKEYRLELGANAAQICEMAETGVVYQQWKEYMESLM